MKTVKTRIFGLFIILLTIVSFSSCKKDIETPPFDEPHFTVPAGATLKTIAQMKAIVGSSSIVIDSNWYIRGVVVATDESGNYFKDIVIQDSTGGIDIKLEKYSLFNNYPLGQMIYVNMNGMYFSNANGTHSLGYKGGTGIVTVPAIMIDAHIFKDKFPGPVPTPVTLTSITCTDNYINTLVVFDNVSFADAGSVFADPLNLLGGMTPRNFTDTLSTTAIILRSSTYANFKNVLLPSGKGSVRGILTKYNTSWQFCIRDINDVYGFAIDPSLILTASFASSLGGFTPYSVTGAQVWAWTSYGATMSGYAAGTYNANEDWLISPALNLTQHTNIKFKFESAMNYGTAGDGSLKVLYSNDYTGTGSPAAATWTEFPTYILSAGAWAFTPSGDIDMSSIGGTTHTYVAFKYVCTTANVATWELKNISIKGQHI